LLHRLSLQFAAAATIDINLWRLNLLQTPLLQERAAVEAGQADIIALSLDNRGGIHKNAEEWIWRWMNHRESNPCLIGVLQDDPEELDIPDPMSGWLSRIASEARLPCFLWNELSDCRFSELAFELAKRRL
jgi:hypothetical protein